MVKQLRKERVYFILWFSGHTASLQEVRARTWRQEPKAGAMEGHGFRHRLHRSVSELSFTAQIHLLRDGTACGTLPPPYINYQ